MISHFSLTLAVLINFFVQNATFFEGSVYPGNALIMRLIW